MPATITPIGWEEKKKKPGGVLGNYGQPLGGGTGGGTTGGYNRGGGTQYTRPGAPSAGGGAVPQPGTMGGVGQAGGSLYNSADADYIRNLPTAYTPEQMLTMRNNARQTNAAQNLGGDMKIRELMAQQGFGGSGMEVGAIMGNQARNNAAMQGALSGIDISNAQTGLQGGLAKGGLMSQLLGVGMDENRLGENARQFDVGQYNDLYKWGNETDYQRYLDRSNKSEYGDQMQQFNQYLRMLGVL